MIIDPRGLILTNAHVAQFLLLKDYSQKDFVTCVGRTGSPARAAYTLKLFYISPPWVQNNYTQITSSKATGTGENDFALLRITGSTNPDVVAPTTFPALALDSNENDVQSGDPALLAAYPGGFLGGIAIERDLYLVSTIIHIGQRFTFKSGSLDAFDLGGSPVAQHGSSGGAAVSGQGKLLGIIVTSTDAEKTADRDLQAISLSHIDRSFSEDRHATLESLLSASLTDFSEKFDREIASGLKKIYIDYLDSKNH